MKPDAHRCTLRGEYPDQPVYKFYSQSQYAHELIEHGRLRLGSLRYYRDIEDSVRRDKDEGTGHIQTIEERTVAYFSRGSDDVEFRREVGPVHHRSEMGNPIYVFSTSMEGVDLRKMSERFGRFIVRIEHPMSFANDLNEALKSRPERFAGGIEGHCVRYNQGLISNESLDDWERIQQSYIQKPDSFASELEFRFIAINTDDHEQRLTVDHIHLTAGKRLEYASLVTI